MRRPVVVLDDATRGTFLVFADPVATIAAETEAELAPALAAIDAARAAGRHLAGLISYELGYLLEDRLAPRLPPHRDIPLLWFGVFAAPPRRVPDSTFDLPGGGRAYAGPLVPDWDRAAYRARFDRVRDLIGAGDIFQANLTMPARFRTVGDPWALFRELRVHGGGAHGAYVDDGRRRILSFSPELFLACDAAGAIRTAPMKGTAARGTDPDTDAALRDGLAASAKDRAENLMIVDLLRNDLGRVARPGSVAVDALFAIETLPTVHQMVSTVSARLRPGTNTAALLAALFPCGSITGAPKIRAMEIIREVEDAPRGAYCGAIGHLAPDGAARLSVAIRTATIADDGSSVLGIGGAVTWDSNADAEHAECLLKARFAILGRRPIGLIETLRYEARRFVRLERHLGRLAASAAVFGIPFDAAAAEATLLAGVRAAGSGTWRVRLELAENGTMTAAAAALEPAPPFWRAAISPVRLRRDDVLLRHKTTWRGSHDDERARMAVPGVCDEVLFLNEQGELCETSRGNLFLEVGGALLTPALSSGLLDGCLRRELLDHRRCREAVLVEDDLARADAVHAGNSLRGLVRLRLQEETPTS